MGNEWRLYLDSCRFETALKSHHKNKTKLQTKLYPMIKYLFKLSEQLLQAEIQANHTGVCEMDSSHSLQCLHLLFKQVDYQQGLRTGR